VVPHAQLSPEKKKQKQTMEEDLKYPCCPGCKDKLYEGVCYNHSCRNGYLRPQPGKLNQVKRFRGARYAVSDDSSIGPILVSERKDFVTGQVTPYECLQCRSSIFPNLEITEFEPPHLLCCICFSYPLRLDEIRKTFINARTAQIIAFGCQYRGDMWAALYALPQSIFEEIWEHLECNNHARTAQSIAVVIQYMSDMWEALNALPQPIFEEVWKHLECNNRARAAQSIAVGAEWYSYPTLGGPLRPPATHI
jgi:hypothetical protein